MNNSPKKILFITTSLTFGGAETQLVQLATKLKKKGWNVYMVSLTSPQAYIKELHSIGIPVISLDIRKSPNPVAIFKLMKLLKFIDELKPDVVHSFMIHANIFSRFLRLFTKEIKILICSARNIDEKGGKRWGKPRELLYRVSDPLCTITTQVCIAGLFRYLSIKAVTKEKIRYIPNGVNIERFKPQYHLRKNLRKNWNLNDDLIWLSVGRLAPAKDHSTLLKAFSVLTNKFKKSFLLIVGTGPLYEKLRELIKRLQIKDKVHFWGISRKIQNLMNVSDGYVMSSVREGMPNVLLEASATGLPIIATDVGGNAEIIINKKTGIMVKAQNHIELAKAMLFTATHPANSKKMSANARKFVISNFSIEKTTEEWEKLYKNYLK